MRRAGASLAVLVVVLAVTSLPANAQDDVDIAELPSLGFALDENEGFAGDDLTGEVNTDDVAEHCLTLEEWVEVMAGTSDEFTLLPLSDYFEGVGDGDIEPPEGADAELGTTLALVLFTLAGGIMQDPEAAAEFAAATNVVTFVDPVTQEMLGDMGDFDADTGEAFIVVPGLDPALYAVAAACVEPMDVESLITVGGPNALVAFTEWIVDNDIEIPPLALEPDTPWAEFVADSAEIWVSEIVQPRAVGIDFYCILDEDGLCAEPPEGIELLEQPPAEEPPGEDPPPAVEDPPAPAPQEATPRLTG